VSGMFWMPCCWQFHCFDFGCSITKRMVQCQSALTAIKVVAFRCRQAAINIAKGHCIMLQLLCSGMHATTDGSDPNPHRPAHLVMIHHAHIDISILDKQLFHSSRSSKEACTVLSCTAKHSTAANCCSRSCCWVGHKVQEDLSK